MPIYEYYCSDCHTIFNFFSRLVSPDKKPNCPRCGKKQLERQISMFAMTGTKSEESELGDITVNESRMESAMMALAGEAENIDENNPKQAADLMRKLSSMTGMKFGKSMEEALNRLESGESPEKIEEEMGDIMEAEDPFIMPGKESKGAESSSKSKMPNRDNTLYEL